MGKERTVNYRDSMTHTKRISEVISNGLGHKELMAVAEKARKRKPRTKIQAPPIGHYLAVFFFFAQEFIDMLFIDHLDVSETHTVLQIDRDHLEVYPVALESIDINMGMHRFYYKNNTYIEVIRVS